MQQKLTLPKQLDSNPEQSPACKASAQGGTHTFCSMLLSYTEALHCLPCSDASCLINSRCHLCQNGLICHHVLKSCGCNQCAHTPGAHNSLSPQCSHTPGCAHSSLSKLCLHTRCSQLFHSQLCSNTRLHSQLYCPHSAHTPGAQQLIPMLTIHSSSLWQGQLAAVSCPFQTR